MQLLRDDEPVFQQVAQARRRLQALRQHPPAALRAARQVECGHMHEDAAGRHQSVHGPQVLRMRKHQRGRQHGLAQQCLRAVDVGQRGVEQPCALRHPGLDGGPLVRGHDERQQLQRPGVRGVAAFGVHVVGRAVFAHTALHACCARRELGAVERCARAQRAQERLPRRGHRPLRRARLRQGAAQFVVAPGCCGADRSSQAQRVGSAGRCGVMSSHHAAHHAPAAPVAASARAARAWGQRRRRSSENGNSTPRTGGSALSPPGVCPIGKKRARRRLSAS